jgi:predicted metalloprotease
MGELKHQFGNCRGDSCKFVMATVVAHEIGHHVQY